MAAKPPEDLEPWLPWSMSEERRREFMAPAVSGTVECRYYGRDFTVEEMALLRALIAGPPPLNRHTLSKEFCRRIGWVKPDGGLKDMMARVTMLAMHKDSLITLPAPTQRQSRPKPIVFGPGHRAAAVPDPDHPRRGPPAPDAHRRARHPRGQALERVRRPLPLPRLLHLGRRPDALRRL